MRHVRVTVEEDRGAGWVRVDRLDVVQTEEPLSTGRARFVVRRDGDRVTHLDPLVDAPAWVIAVSALRCAGSSVEAISYGLTPGGPR